MFDDSFHLLLDLRLDFAWRKWPLLFDFCFVARLAPFRTASRRVAGLPFFYIPKIQAYFTFEWHACVQWLHGIGKFRMGWLSPGLARSKDSFSFRSTVSLKAIKRGWLSAKINKDFPWDWYSIPTRLIRTWLLWLKMIPLWMLTVVTHFKCIALCSNLKLDNEIWFRQSNQDMGQLPGEAWKILVDSSPNSLRSREAFGLVIFAPEAWDATPETLSLSCATTSKSWPTHIIGNMADYDQRQRGGRGGYNNRKRRYRGIQFNGFVLVPRTTKYRRGWHLALQMKMITTADHSADAMKNHSPLEFVNNY